MKKGTCIPTVSNVGELLLAVAVLSSLAVATVIVGSTSLFDDKDPVQTVQTSRDLCVSYRRWTQEANDTNPGMERICE